MAARPAMLPGTANALSAAESADRTDVNVILGPPLLCRLFGQSLSS
jgi:hypothetical protein